VVDSSVPDLSSSREAELSRQLQERDEQLQRANARIALLEAKIDLLVRKLFGAQSEKLDPAQLLLLLQGMDEPGKAPEPVGGSPVHQPPLSPPPPRRRPHGARRANRLRVNEGRGCLSICP
jgi:hypothetical protein